METNKKLPYPFERIALAVSASSSFMEELIEVTFSLSKIFGADVYFIHVGNEITAKYIEEKITEKNLSKISFEFIVTKGDVVDSLLDVCKKKNIDLLIGGALEKENPYKYYLGSVSRTLCRKAKCSVLMIKEPIKVPFSLSKIVVNCTESEKTEYTIKTAVYLCKSFELNSVYLVFENYINSLTTVFNHECTEDDAAIIKAYENKLEKEKYQRLLEKINFDKIKPHAEFIYSKPGFGISSFARKINADLLVVNSPDKKLGFIDRIFPNDLEYTLENLPSSLLIVQSRPE
jgi:nucleotide-binding universal stress UspA family protein